MSDNEIYFEPKTVNDIFVEISKRKHGSGSEDEVRKYVINYITSFKEAHPEIPLEVVHYDAAATDPGQRCIVLRRAASPGMENCPGIVLQGHMDMVCVPPDMIYPITLTKYKDENNADILKAGGFDEKSGTTLGADDGIGIATGLAMITATDRKMGPMECLFTVQEETNMGGAEGFDTRWLQGRQFINLDSETVNVITFGSAGGSCATFQLAAETAAVPRNYLAARITLSGLTGGHSGIDIDKGRGNAIKLLTQLLRTLRQINRMAVNVVSFEAGTYSNAIPNKAVLTVAFAPQQTFGPCSLEDFHRWCNEILANYRQVYQESDPRFDWYIEEFPIQSTMLADHCSDNLVDLLSIIPTGLRKMLPDPRYLVETSSNLAIIKANLQTDPNQLTVICSNRSSVADSLTKMEDMETAIAGLFGASLEIGDRYPAWPPNPESELLTIAKDVYNTQFHGDYQFEVIHAGLECSYIVSKYPAGEADCIAVGPLIMTPHTWNERLQTATVATFYDSVMKIIDKVWSGN